jgi:hypothetical protein
LCSYTRIGTNDCAPSCLHTPSYSILIFPKQGYLLVDPAMPGATSTLLDHVVTEMGPHLGSDKDDGPAEDESQNSVTRLGVIGKSRDLVAMNAPRRQSVKL